MRQQRCVVCHKLRRRVERPDRRQPGTRGEGGQRIAWRGEHVMSRWCGGCPWCVLRVRERLLSVLWAGVRRGLRVADDMVDTPMRCAVCSHGWTARPICWRRRRASSTACAPRRSGEALFDGARRVVEAADRHRGAQRGSSRVVGR